MVSGIRWEQVFVMCDHVAVSTVVTQILKTAIGGKRKVFVLYCKRYNGSVATF